MKRAIFVCAVVCAVVSGESQAAGVENSRSGVAQPKVTMIKPITVFGGGMTAHEAGGHEGHDMGSAGATSSGLRPEINDYPLPVKYSAPFAIAVDSNGIVWFTEMSNHSLGRLDPKTGELKEYRLPSTEGLPEAEWTYDPKSKLTTPESYDVYSVGNPGSLIVAKNGMIWFVTLLGNSVTRFDPAKEEFTEFMVPTDHAQPYDLAEDLNGRIWYVQKNGGKLAFLDVEAKKMVEIPLDPGASPMGIVIDKNGKVWYGDVAGNYLGRFDPETKKLKKFEITVPVSQPGQMRFDHTGNLWVCNLHSQQLGVLIPDPGVYSVVPLPGYNTVPQSLAPDHKGRIWVVDSMMNQVGFFDSTSLKWNMWEVPTANSQPMGITVDGAGDIWFTQSDRMANRISRLKASTMKEEAPKPEGAASAHQGHAATPEKDSSRMGLLVVILAVGALLVAGGVIMVRRGRR